jgi:hypothetical protein
MITRMFVILDGARPDMEGIRKRLKLGGGQAYDRSRD